MKITNTLIDEVIAETAGEDVVRLVRQLKNKKNISEFKLAETLKAEVNAVRNMLYRLHSQNLVTFIRRKDKKKGWYIYYWTFNGKHIKFLLSDLKRNKLKKFKDRLDKEQNIQFFMCENGCIRTDFEQAMNFEFKCPECGQILNQQENGKTVDNLKKQIKDLEKEIKGFTV